MSVSCVHIVDISPTQVVQNGFPLRFVWYCKACRKAVKVMKC